MKIDYQNDIVFKKTLGDDDSRDFLNYFIQTFAGVTFSNYVVTNKENLGKHVGAKKNYLYIRAINSNGEVTLVEMQRSPFTAILADRFLDYSSNELVVQIQAGDDYSKLKGVIEIILTPYKHGQKLVTKYQIRDEFGNLYPNNKLTFIVVSLANLKLEKYDAKELLAYAYQKGSVDDIIKLTNDNQLKEMLTHMENKYQQVMDNSLLKTEAQIAAYEAIKEKEKEDYFRNEGKIEGKIEGKLEGKIEGKIEGKLEAKIEVIQNLMTTLNLSLEQALNIANITKEEYEQYHQ